MPTRNFQFGFAEETTYGTRAVPTRFIEPNSYDTPLEIERIEARGLRAGTKVASSQRWSSGKKETGAPVECFVPYSKAGSLFKALLGASATIPPRGATNPRRHTSTIAASLPSLTIQVAYPDQANTARPWDVLGCLCNSGTLSGTVDDALMAEMEYFGSTIDNSQSLASAVYATTDGIFTFTGASLTLAGSSYQCKEFSVTVNNNLERRFYFGSANSEKPVANNLVEITGEVQSDYLDNTAVNRFINGTTAALVAHWDGATIEGSFKYYVDISIPVVRFDGEVPSAGGPELVGQPLQFKALDDGAQEPISIAYQNIDTAI